MQPTRLETFHQSHVVVVVDVVVVRRDRVGVETWLSQLVQRTRLGTFRQSQVVVVVDVAVVVVVVFVGAYSPVTDNHARELRGSTPRDDVGLMDPVIAHSDPLLDVAGTGAGEGRAFWATLSLHSVLMLSLTEVPSPHRAKVPLVP